MLGPIGEDEDNAAGRNSKTARKRKSIYARAEEGQCPVYCFFVLLLPGGHVPDKQDPFV